MLARRRKSAAAQVVGPRDLVQLGFVLHGDMRTLRMLLREAAENEITLVGLDECLGDSTDGAYKQADGTCRDDAH